MDPKLLRFVKNNDWPGFLNEYMTQNPRTNLTPQAIRGLFDGAKLGPTQTNTTSGSGGGSGSVSGGGSGGGNMITTALSNTAEFAKQLIETQESKPGSYLPNLETQLLGVNDVYDIFIDKTNKTINSPQKIVGSVMTLAASKLKDFYTEQTTLLEQVNQKAMLTGTLSEDFRATITDANPRLVQLGISFQELADAAITVVQESGRFALVNQQTLEKAGEVGKAYVGSMQDMVSLYDDFEKVGLGAMDANLAIERAGKRSMELGLQSKKTITDLAANMDKINSYGFKNGIDGLATMARKATEFRMSMQEVFNIADKVMNPEGALELSANLQVLGGAIGDFNDPLKLMYMSTNNVEGLQDALIGAAGSLATYNSEQGRFEITGVNLRRAQEMARQMGIDYKQLAQGAIAAAEKSAAASDMIASGLVLEDDQREFLTNIARMKDGKMVIDLGGSQKLMDMFGAQEVALDQLNDEKARQLLKYQDELKEKTTEDIARGQATAVENIRRDVNFLALVARNTGGKKILQLADELGVGPENVKKLAASSQQETRAGGQLVSNVVNEAGNALINGVKEVKQLTGNLITGQNMTNQNKQPNATTQTIVNNNNTTTTAAASTVPTKIVIENVIQKENENSYFVTQKVK
jgi:hypothetical protein